MSKRLSILLGGILLLGGLFFWLRPQKMTPVVKVGVLHSSTGTMALSEQPVIDATLFAIEELNRQGGVLGRRLEPVLADGASDPAVFATEADRLVNAEQVAAVFGCWTSASRKAVKEVVEAANHLLVYPLQYEGVEDSPAIIYTGSVPNQQIKPAVKWALDNLGDRFYLVGSDYIFPRIANHLIRDLSGFLGATIVAEQYRPLGSDDFAPICQEIATLKPAVIFNTLNGDSNLAFFTALHQQGLSCVDIPVLSFSLSETELQVISSKLSPSVIRGHYASWGYFETLSNQVNQSFLQRFRARYGQERRVNGPMVAAYVGVQLWAQAVVEAGSFEPQQVRRAFSRQSLTGPGGIIYIDDQNHHAWLPIRIGRIGEDGRFEIVWDSRKPIRPEPYPIYAQKRNWEELEAILYQHWGNQWAASPEAE